MEMRVREIRWSRWCAFVVVATRGVERRARKRPNVSCYSF
jgi:hypothetical protein